MKDALVDLKGAGVSRGGRWLVRCVDLTVRRGEILTLIGPNGSGKSTTAKMAIGLLKPDEGTAERSARLRIGYVPQKLAIDWTLPLTVERLMTLTNGLTSAEIDETLNSVGIAHLRKAEVQHLSGGEFQRALLARAAARKPDLLVLDEPVQGVDFSGEAALYELIDTIRDRTRCGIILISHDLHVVMARTDTVICLNGHVCCRGTPELVAASEAYRHLFGPRAAASVAVYRHSHDHTHLPDGRVRHADGRVTDRCHPADGRRSDRDDAGHEHGHAAPGRVDGGGRADHEHPEPASAGPDEARRRPGSNPAEAADAREATHAR